MSNNEKIPLETDPAQEMPASAQSSPSVQINWNVPFGHRRKSQEVGLPDGEITLPPLSKRLGTDPSQLSSWIEEVEIVLEANGLAALIDHTIPRPATYDSDTGKKWSTLSRQIRNWLISNMTNELLFVMCNEQEMDHADDFVHLLKETMCRYDHWDDVAKIEEILKMKIKRYRTTRELIDALNQQFKRLHKIKAPVSVLFMIHMMVKELRERTVDELTYDDLHVLVHKTKKYLWY